MAFGRLEEVFSDNHPVIRNIVLGLTDLHRLEVVSVWAQDVIAA